MADDVEVLQPAAFVFLFDASLVKLYEHSQCRLMHDFVKCHANVHLGLY